MYASSDEVVEKIDIPEPSAQARQLDNASVVKTSKKMSSILRHSKNPRVLREDGWVPVSKMLTIMHCSRDHLLMATIENNKNRFSIGRGKTSGKEFVRANQGHSIPVHLDMKMIVDRSTVCIHGTSKKAWIAIEKNGLSIMNRQHIHMASGMPGQVVSGMRNTSKVAIFINIGLAMDDGIEFFESENGVILSSGIDGIIAPKYFENVKFL